MYTDVIHFPISGQDQVRVPGRRCCGEDVADHLVHDERLPQRVRPHRHRHLRRRRTRRRGAREEKMLLACFNIFLKIGPRLKYRLTLVLVHLSWVELDQGCSTILLR